MEHAEHQARRGEPRLLIALLDYLRPREITVTLRVTGDEPAKEAARQKFPPLVM
jgi:hypothetical protein